MKIQAIGWTHFTGQEIS